MPDPATAERQRVLAAREDRSAFREVYVAHVDAVFAYVLRRTGDRALAEDLTGDTFERALGAIQRYEWRGIPVRYWLIRIADRVTTDHFRRRARRPTVSLAEEDLPAHSESAERAALRRHDLAEVRAAIDELTPAQRVVVILRLGEGLSHRAIGQRLGRGEGAVRMLYQRGLGRIREELVQDSG